MSRISEIKFYQILWWLEMVVPIIYNVRMEWLIEVVSEIRFYKNWMIFLIISLV